MSLGKLCSDTHRERDLRLATSVLAVDLADTARFEAATKDLVKCLAASTDLETCPALLLELSASDESSERVLKSHQLVEIEVEVVCTHRALATSILHLLDLDIGEAFDVLECLHHGTIDLLT